MHQVRRHIRSVEVVIVEWYRGETQDLTQGNEFEGREAGVRGRVGL
jgi:hypothetical protein